MSTITTIAHNLLNAREQFAAAEAAKKAAEAAFVALAQAQGITEVELTEDGKTVRVAVENRPRREFDVSILAQYLPVELVAQLLKEVIDPKAFDNAVGAGLVPEDIAQKAVTTEYSTQVRVYGERGVRAPRN